MLPWSAARYFVSTKEHAVDHRNNSMEATESSKECQLTVGDERPICPRRLSAVSVGLRAAYLLNIAFLIHHEHCEREVVEHWSSLESAIQVYRDFSISIAFEAEWATLLRRIGCALSKHSSKQSERTYELCLAHSGEGRPEQSPEVSLVR
jgi:hypothetical protein